MASSKGLKLDEIAKRQRKALEAYAKTVSGDLEAQAKKSRPWTDRTANARNSIKGSYEAKGDVLTIGLSGNTDYFIYLELANEKKYAILKPTIDSNAEDIKAGFKEVIKK